MSLLLLPASLWASGALWYRLPAPTPLRIAAVALFLIATIIAARWLWLPGNRRGLLLIATLWLGIGLWWATLRPSHDRDWQPDMAHIATAQIDGDILTVQNVRNFVWRSETDFDQRWETRRYNLAALTSTDLFLSHWSGESVAHAIISFNFTDSLPLAFSIEIRKQRGESYSPYAGFFKQYELAVIAADERDIVKVRATVRGEDVRLFRLDMQQATTRALLGEYVAVANTLAANPRWYHTLTTNCTTVIYAMAHRLDRRIALDWRILLPGKLPSYLREREFVSRSVPLETLVARSHIGPVAAGPHPDPGFSRRIRNNRVEPARGIEL
ncbi:hypothetical protein FHS79_000083 [Polymorphobacter multimanifer]|uniref:Lnb N-terminal periplasmic domain-containing protein n=1 Tax=Polymorphobacter multimanifer TaxID=1070431 RepID=A0A841L9V1_9SPHN|nr:hypothetical protein [Polymorphobacter multimanifer]